MTGFLAELTCYKHIVSKSRQSWWCWTSFKGEI